MNDKLSDFRIKLEFFHQLFVLDFGKKSINKSELEVKFYNVISYIKLEADCLIS